MCNENTLAERIQYAMDKRDITQADLSRETGLSTAVISQIVSGKTKNPTLRRTFPISISAIGEK